MKHAILHFRDRHLPEQGPEKPVSVALVTGSLGPGGAERQLTRLAGELTRLAEQPGQVPLDLLPKPEKVEVLVKQHTEPSGSAKQGLDFFLPVLVKAQIPVTEINKLPPVSVSHQSVPEGRLGRLLEQLPPPVHYGVTRLAPVLRTNPFDVVSLWQDGTCLFGALAALLAGAPTIHLVFRAAAEHPQGPLPRRVSRAVPGPGPGARRALRQQQPQGGRAYSEWLGIPIVRFHVLYNGVPDLATDAAATDQDKWRAFQENTADATETIGGVFRLEPDKRPQLWIKLAALYLKQRPRRASSSSATAGCTRTSWRWRKSCR